jgi:hypothetical protein
MRALAEERDQLQRLVQELQLERDELQVGAGARWHCSAPCQAQAAASAPLRPPAPHLAARPGCAAASAAPDRAAPLPTPPPPQDRLDNIDRDYQLRAGALEEQNASMQEQLEGLANIHGRYEDVKAQNRELYNQVRAGAAGDLARGEIRLPKKG